MKTITVDGVEHAPVMSVKTDSNNLRYCMVRTFSAGVFCGYYKRGDTPKEAVVYQAKRIHKWEGAASLSELAQRGTSKPDRCRIPMAVSEVYLTEVIEVIPMAEEAIITIEKVPLWTA